MTREGGALSVQRGDLVAGRYRVGEPLGPAWRVWDETSGAEVVLVPVALPGGGAGAGAADAERWRNRRGILPVTGTATGDAGAWLVAEPVPARTLAAAIAQWGALPAEQVLTIAAGAVTALSGTGPRLLAAAENILLTDDGSVLLLPIETTEDDLFPLGTALFHAAEGRSPFDPATTNPRHPALAALIRDLMARDPDRAGTLERTFAELSRLGAPLEAAHGADSLHEAQVASAKAAEDSAATQAVSVTSHAVPADEVEPEADSEATRQVPSIATAGDAIAAPDTDADSAATRPVSSITAVSEAIPADEATQPAPALIADADSATTRQVPNIAAVSDAIPAHEATQPVPASDEADRDTATTRPVAIAEAAAGAAGAAAAALLADGTREFISPDAASTQALPMAPAPAEPSPTRTEPLPAQTNPFVPPTQAAEAVPAPPQAALPMPVAPPTQAAAAVPPPGAAAPNPWLQPPQPPGAWQQGGPAQQPMPGGFWGPGPGQPPMPPGPPGQPFYPMQGPPKKGGGGKTAAIIVGAVAAVAGITSLVVLATRSNGGGSSDNVGNAANSSSRSTPSSSVPTSVPGTNFPTDSASGSSGTAAGNVTDTASSSDSYTPPPELTSTPFDPNSLNEQSTDKTPLELNALVPQEFTDDKGVHYSLKAGSIQPCVQTDMSANMQDILTSNSCSKEIAASFVDDSGQYLVSVKVLPLPDQHTATVVYNDLQQQSAADFGIWCPQSGPGSTACQGDYQSATIKQYREQQHRYIVLTVALAVNHSQSTDIAPWLDAAAKKAVDSAGPGNWSGNR